ncbi:MAG TPA: hypothetical protein VMA77_09870 [Solirubrobacteraceae bacterium]|nr:hypothetical protein [Solirubrobacteraceae bacterium]
MSETFPTRMFNARHLEAVIEAERIGVPFLLWLDHDGEQAHRDARRRPPAGDDRPA